jgi:tRNA modification GTPase
VSDTIFALATAPGRGAVAIVRISGPSARDALRSVAGAVGRPGQASLRRLRDQGGETLDSGLTLFFAGPNSYTGEDCAELHVHGGQGVVDGVTDTLLALGLRLAEPGEFTRRAFENGKLDLDQAEAVADLVDSETRNQARQALGQLEGRLGERYKAWRSLLIEAMARLEAAVDFPDEEIPAGVIEEARRGLEQLAGELDAALADEARGQRVREGYRIAIIGAPNAGKSSLINALAGRDAAIVTHIPGATRDIIEVPLVIEGYKALLADMAGIRVTHEPVEVEGVRRARGWAAAADLRLWLVDQADSSGAWREAVDLVRAGDILVLNKSDLEAGSDLREARAAAAALNLETLTLSLVDGQAEPLLARLVARLRRELSGAEFPAATRARHERLLREARGSLGRALDELRDPELAAEDARLAARALERINGRVDSEAVLERVFATFCIGK